MPRQQRNADAESRLVITSPLCTLTLTMNVTDLNTQIFQRLHPKAYLERFLAEQIRPDGREAAEWRDLFVHVGSISTADGSALVRLGETTIVCGVKAEIAEPDLEQPTEGFIGSHLLATEPIDRDVDRLP
jgi:exosome complex component RRP43